MVTIVTKKKPARKADGRTFEYKKSSSLGRHNRIGNASGGDEAQGCEGLSSDAGDNSTEGVESEFEERGHSSPVPRDQYPWVRWGAPPSVMNSLLYKIFVQPHWTHTPQKAL